MDRSQHEISPLGQALLKLKEEILQSWMELAQENIKKAETLRQPILINTLPSYIDSLAKVVTPLQSATGMKESFNIADEHGAERARLTAYNPTDVIQEYHLFRKTLLDVLHRHKIQPTTGEFKAINDLIETSVRNSVTSFELVQSRIREQFVATLTHDLRNPLGAADMAAELILLELDNPAEIAGLVAKIKDNLKRVNRMIQDLLDATTIRVGGRLNLQLEETQMGEIINQAVRDQILIHGKRFETTGDNVRGFWDRSALLRALETCSRTPLSTATRSR